MLISDVQNKDEITALIITDLKDLGVKYRKEKKAKTTQVKTRLFVVVIFCTNSCLNRKNAVENRYSGFTFISWILRM